MNNKTRTLIAAIGLASAVSTQQRWSTAHAAPEGYAAFAMCYHAADGRMVAVDSRQDSAFLDTWEWDGAGWQQRYPVQAPTWRRGVSLAYDARRRVVVMFGGHGAFPGHQATNEIWEWDGATWRLRQTTGGPAARAGAAMAFDSQRGRTVVYGGSGAGGAATFADQWEWDGATWSQVPITGLSPGARGGARMVFDAARGVMVLYGGIGPGFSVLGDVWEFGGQAWGPTYSGVTNPPALIGASMTFDAARSRTLLYGGYQFGGGDNVDLWEWDGARWTVLSPGVVRPGRRDFPGLAIDETRDELVLCGGTIDGETWVQNRTTFQWTRRQALHPFAVGPTPVAFDGTDTTFVLHPIGMHEWDHASRTWSRWPSSTFPLPTLAGAMTFDVLRNELLYVAAQNGVTETWVANPMSRTWRRHSPANTPPATDFASLAYDVTRGRCVLFGGQSVVTLAPNDQTWEWDGANWLQITPAVVPPGRWAAAMQFDYLTNRTVLFGGADGTQMLNDVWDWDGATWSLRAMSSPAPAPRVGAQSGSLTDGVVIAGGRIASGAAAPEVWLILANAWVPLEVGGSMPVVPLLATVDTSRSELVTYFGTIRNQGRYAIGAALPGIWIYGLPRAEEIAFGGNCGASSTGVPELASSGLPVLGDASYALTASNFAPQQAAALLFGANVAVAELPNECRLFVTSPFAIVSMTTQSNGTATLPIALPTMSGLEGVDLFVQAAAIDPAGPQIVLTTVLQLRLGR